MGRYSTTDFGYDFPSKPEETTSLVAPLPNSEEHCINNENNATGFMRHARSSEDGAGYELYNDNEQPQQEQQQTYRYKPAKAYRGGEHFFVTSDGSDGTSVNPVECIGALCCCITITFVILGGILVASVKYKNSDPYLLVGSVLLVISAGTCLCGCFTMCIGTAADGLFGSNSNSSSKADPHFHEVQVRFRRLNDRYEKGCVIAECGLQEVRLDVVGHMKEVKQALRKEAKKKGRKRKKENRRVGKACEKGSEDRNSG